MKNFTKICLILCAILAALGIVGCVAGIGMGFKYQNFKSMVQNGDFSFPGSWFYGWWYDDDDYVEYDKDYNQSDWTKNAYSYEQADVQGLDGEFEFGEVRFEASSTDKLEVELSYRSIWNSYRRTVDCYVEDGILNINDELDSGLWNIVKNHAEKASLIIRIPEGFQFEEFEFHDSAGTINVNTVISAVNMNLSVDAGEVTYGSQGALQSAGEMELSVDAGSMKLKNITASSLDVECGVGQINLEQVQADNAKVSCDVGTVKMEMLNRESDYSYSVQCDVGKVKLGNTSYTGLVHHKEQQNGTGNRNFQVECGIGQVKVTFQE